MDKPLHVQIAEILGWTGVTNEDAPWWYGHPPGGVNPEGPNGYGIYPAVRDGSGRCGIPRYDTDWSATGPLIERFGMDLRYARMALTWYSGECNGILVGQGEKPLLAVCNLILALHTAGKLEAPQEQVTS